MALKAFVLMEIQVGKKDAILAELRDLKGVREAHFVTGPYDVIVVLEMEEVTDLASLIGVKIPSIASVTKTVTCIAMDDSSAFEYSL